MDQITELLTRGVSEVINKEDLEKKLRAKNKLRVKLGIDPTSPNIHIGRAVVLWKLRAFQELGHQVVFIVGDFTGLVGDTSDKDAERPMMTKEQIKQNIKSYFDQAGQIIDAKKAEMHYNSTWLKKLGFLEIAEMADLFGLHEMSARENIKKRLDAGKRVSLRELLYPLMQGFDSVAIKADVELGGTDQRFNLLAGRTIQPKYNQTAQNILTTEIMEGTDGRKMSSSWGNTINITAEANDMFGKIMSIEDKLIKKYFTLATRVPLPEVDEIILNNQNPRDQKLILAEKITALYHGSQKALSAKQAFINQFSKGQLPDDIAEVKIKPGGYQISQIAVLSGLVSSRSEARRIMEQGGVKLSGNVEKFDDTVLIKGGDNLLLQVGKRKFVKII